MPPARSPLHTERWQLPPTTAMIPQAQHKYSKRFRATYRQHRPRFGAPGRTSSANSTASRARRSRSTVLQFTVTFLPDLRDILHQRIPPLPNRSPSNPNYTPPRDEYRQLEYSHYPWPHSYIICPYLDAIAAWSVDFINGMIRRDPNDQRRRRAHAEVETLSVHVRPLPLKCRWPATIPTAHHQYHPSVGNQ